MRWPIGHTLGPPLKLTHMLFFSLVVLHSQSSQAALIVVFALL
jgi:hypothetical protein